MIEAIVATLTYLVLAVTMPWAGFAWVVWREPEHFDGDSV